MNKYDLLYNSLQKNIQEFIEFIVDNFKITSYYNLTDLIVYLHNFMAKTYVKNKELAFEIEKELKENE